MTVIIKIIFFLGIVTVSLHDSYGAQVENREARKIGHSKHSFEYSGAKEDNNEYKCQGYYDCMNKLDKKNAKIASLQDKQRTLLTTLTTENQKTVDQAKMIKKLKPQTKKFKHEIEILEQSIKECSHLNNMNINEEAIRKNLLNKVEIIIGETASMCTDLIDGFNVIHGDTVVYYISTTTASWWAAQNECRIHGMNLVSIDNHNKLYYLKGEIIARSPISTDYYWIGLNNFATNDDSYTWIGTGDGTDQNTSDGTVSTTDWATNEPAAVATNNCVGISGIDDPVTQLAWYSEDCVQSFYYICELPAVCSHLYQ